MLSYVLCVQVVVRSRLPIYLSANVIRIHDLLRSKTWSCDICDIFCCTTLFGLWRISRPHTEATLHNGLLDLCRSVFSQVRLRNFAPTFWMDARPVIYRPLQFRAHALLSPIIRGHLISNWLGRPDTC